MASVNYGSVPFAQQISFFRQKLNIPTNHWTDIYNKEHDYAFVVAGANRDDLLADFRTAVEKAISEGTTLEQFRKDFDRIVEQYGWDYNGGRNWRSRVIYETNLTSSYNAGRYEQLQAQKSALPYWRYRHSDLVEDPRPEHQAWDGLILRADDPWWHTHYPPNGWGCQCYVEGLTEEDLAALGKTGPDTAPPAAWQTREIGKRNPNGPTTVRVPAGIDPSFEHAPGQSRLQSAVPPERPEPPARGGNGLPNRVALDALPAPRVLPADAVLPAGLDDAAYANAFLNQFGAQFRGDPVVFKDVMGSALVMGDSLFERRGKAVTDNVKANKNERGPYMGIMARAVIEPDEIWVRLEYQHKEQKSVVRRRYIARFTLPGQDVPALAVWEHSKEGWSGITTYPVSQHDINDLRVGVRIYRREE